MPRLPAPSHDQSPLPLAAPAVPSLDRDTFGRFFELSLDLCCIANLAGYFLRVNPSFSRVLGYSEAELLARPFLELLHPQDLEATQAALQVLGQGISVVRFENRYRDATGRYHDLEWSAQASAGLVYAAARDQSEGRQLQHELITNRNREHAILNRTPAVIYVKGVDHRYQFINHQYSELFHVTQEEILGRDDHYLFTPEVAAQVIANDDAVIRSGEALTVEEQVPLGGDLHTYISVKFPLRDAAGRISAVAGISTDVTDRLRARDAEQELQLAHAFQRSLYPSQPPSVVGLEIAGAAFPVAQVCGDYFDYIPLGPQRLALSLGDVAGHGYRPALQMVELRSSLRILLRHCSSLAATIESLNRILCEDFSVVPSFVSLFVAVFDVPTQSLSYIGGGHNGFLIQADGCVSELESTALVLGVDPHESYAGTRQATWRPGDIFTVFTDGFSEAFSSAGQPFGAERVLASLQRNRSHSAEEMIAQLFAEVSAFAGTAKLHDDMTIIVVKAT